VNAICDNLLLWAYVKEGFKFIFKKVQKQMNSAIFPIFEAMPSVNPWIRTIETLSFPSSFLERDLRIDFYLPPGQNGQQLDVLLINDGQDLQTMHFESILADLYRSGSIRPVLCVGIHAGAKRKWEYGAAVTPDYKGRGNLAAQYTAFVTGELIPAIRTLFPGRLSESWSFAGFSLGGLSALDISWNNGDLFRQAGIFSGSLWWRLVDKDDPLYSDDHHRIMHNQIREDEKKPGLKFFFQCGTEDESEDRNGNGIIDSIDDTKDLIAVLLDKGYDPETDILYYEMDGGRHDVPTWAEAFPFFLEWAFPPVAVPAVQQLS